MAYFWPNSAAIKKHYRLFYKRDHGKLKVESDPSVINLQAAG
jgi:hypothetical protein